MVGTWRTIYNLIGWNYPNNPSNRTLQARAEMLIQIRKSKLKLKTSKKKRSRSQHKPKKFKMKKT